MDEKEKKLVNDEEVKKESCLKRFGCKIGNGVKWCWEKRHWFEAGAVGLGIVYLKGYTKGGLAHQRVTEELMDRDREFMKALTGDVTGLSEEKVNQAMAIRDVVEELDLDTGKLMDIYENWSEDDWEEFLKEKYGC